MGTMLKVQGIITTVLPSVSDGDITAQTTFAELNPDSLELVEMVMEAEDAFGITIMEEQAEQLQTVGELVALIEAEQQKAAQPA